MRKTRLGDAHPVAFAAITVMKMASADADTAMRQKARNDAPRRSPGTTTAVEPQGTAPVRPRGFRLRWLLGRARSASSAPSARPAP
jgi:hypothetical protein